MTVTKYKPKLHVPADLHVHSTFSIYDGMGSPKAVVDRAKALGWTSCAITEHGWLGSTPTFYKACRENGINPIIGCELYVVPDDHLGLNIPEVRKSYHLTTLALSKEGYHNLVAWSTFANRRDDEVQNFYGKPRISLSAMVEVAPHPLHHNVVFSGCLSGELLSFIMKNRDNGWINGAIAYVKMMQGIFPNFFLETQNHRVDKYADRGFEAYDGLLNIETFTIDAIEQLHRKTGAPLVVTNDSHLQTASQRKAHIAMKSVTGAKHGEGSMDNMSTTALSHHLNSYVYFGNYMRSMDEVADGIPSGQAALDNVVEIIKESNVKLDPLDNFKYSIPFSGYNDPKEKMAKRSKRRLKEVKNTHGKEAVDRFQFELDSMGDFGHYLLIVSDICRWMKKNGILYNTRGSAANSLLCYCLEIHDIDPMPDAYNLIFSRFYNPARKKVPDIDLDIERDRYEDVVRFVKEYMEEREGPGQVVQICNLGTMANRSAFRMIAESKGISKEQIEEITKLLPSMIDSGMVDEEEDIYAQLKDQYPDIYALTSEVFDSIKSISQHACGWLVGTKDRPIDEWVPLTLIASSNVLVTQYDMKVLGDFGLTKLDLLRLKTLSVIQRTRRSLGQDSLDITDIPLDDEKTFEMIRAGKTEGVFTLQGKENRRGVMEVEAKTVHDVIAAVAIYRPALTREHKDVLYNNRRLGKEKVSYPHPLVERVLSPTYGVAIFQEQAMELGYAVGLDDDGVDKIYQAIKMAMGVGKGAKEAFEKFKQEFLDAAKRTGFSKTERKETWELLKSFQGYGFNKGHATSYGQLAVRAAYLKCHYPQEFYTSLLDVYPEKHKYIASAKAEGFRLIPPDVSYSGGGFSKGDSKDSIRVGLSRIRGLGAVSVREIINGQPFSSFSDFRQKTTARSVNKSRIEILSVLGAFDSLGISRPTEYNFTKKVQGKVVEYNLKGHALIDYYLLGFCMDKPEAFNGIKPEMAKKRKNNGWTHAGLYSGAELTEGPMSVSKLFWIPPLPKQEIHEVKASSWAKVKTHLLTAIDENGIPFQIKVNEDKKEKVELLNFLANKCRGSVVCIDGAIRQPFLYDGPLSFSFFNITGAFKDNAQLFTNSNRQDDFRHVLEQLTQKAARASRRT